MLWYKSASPPPVLVRKFREDTALCLRWRAALDIKKDGMFLYGDKSFNVFLIRNMTHTSEGFRVRTC
jgi:hypothetical protein